MKIYDNNIEMMKEYMPEFYSKIEEKLGEYCKENNGIAIEFLKARDGSLYMQSNKKSVISRFNSSYSPIREAKQWAEQFEYNNYCSVVVMYGLGCGHFAREIIDKLGEKDLLIIYEPVTSVFLEILHEVDISDLIKDERVYLAHGKDGLKDVFNMISSFVPWGNINGLSVPSHPMYETVFDKEYDDFVDVVNEVITAIKTEGNTENYFGKDIAYNTVKNMIYTPNSYYLPQFVDAFEKDAVGIVVAAGPSLDKNIHVLHQLKEKAVIIATDTSMRRLYAEGIVPDFVVSVDPRKPISLFENCGFENVPFMCKIDSNPEVLKVHKGKKIWINPSEFHMEMHIKLGMPIITRESGGSVATMTFSIMNMLGIKNIVLIGQDLAYDGNATHAGGWDNRIRGEENSIEFVKGNEKAFVKTRGDWVIYLKWYERAIAKLPEDVRVINATEGGAYISGTEIMTLQEVADNLCTKDLHVSEIIQAIFDSADESQYEKTKQFIENCRKDLKKVVKKIDKGVALCNRFERQYSKAKSLTPEVVSIMNEIANINKVIENMDVYWLIDDIVKSEDKQSIYNIYESNEDEYTANMDMINNTKHIFELVGKAAKELLPEFDNTINEINRGI